MTVSNLATIALWLSIQSQSDQSQSISYCGHASMAKREFVRTDEGLPFARSSVVTGNHEVGLKSEFTRNRRHDFPTFTITSERRARKQELSTRDQRSAMAIDERSQADLDKELSIECIWSGVEGASL